MKKLKSLPLLLFFSLAIACFSVSCGEDAATEENVDYVVDVQIISPNNNATIAVGESFVVEVDYTRKDNIIHNIKVEIVDMIGNSIKNLVERHAHVANEFTFKSDPISINQAGTYIVRAATTDLLEEGEDETSEIVVEHTITVQ